jgi:hypothetical protein
VFGEVQGYGTEVRNGPAAIGGMAAAAATLTAHTLSFDKVTMPFTQKSSQASGATLDAISAKAVADSCSRQNL